MGHLKTAWGTICVLALVSAPRAEAQEPVSFPTPDGGLVYADDYGQGDHGVVLVHGGRFDKESWAPQAERLAESGFHALAIDLRGHGDSRAGSQSTSDAFQFDVLAAVQYLRERGARTVSVVGASLGGWAAAQASVISAPGDIDRLVLLAHPAVEEPEAMKGSKLFITTRDDPGPDGSPRLVQIQEQFDRATEPKELLILEGSAHAQFVFDTPQAEQMMRAIVGFLSER